MAFVFKDNLDLARILFSKKKDNHLYNLGDQKVSYEALNAKFTENVRELTHEDGVFNLYKYDDNKNTIFALITRALTDVTPKNVIDTYGMFADVMTIAQGDTYIFKKRIGEQRAKQFITRGALAGQYETFELADEKVEIKTTAYTAAARMNIEDFLDGRGMWSDYIRIINEGMDEAVYKEIAKALIQAIELFPRANKTAVSAFDEASFDRLLQTVAVYGQPVIYCTLEAAMTLMPTNDWMSDSMKEERFNIGYFARYKGCPVVILPQSFTDETNEMKIIDPSYLYIFPTNNTKPVQIVFEGQTLVKEWDTQRDWSRELHTYRKFGVGIFTTNNLAVYRNTSLQMQNVPGPWPNP